MTKQVKPPKNSKPVVITSVFWILVAALVIAFIMYGNAKYNSGVMAGFDRAQNLLQSQAK